MAQSYYDPNQQGYQGQPQSGYYQQPPQIQRSDTGRSMAITAIICFAVAWYTHVRQNASSRQYLKV